MKKIIYSVSIIVIALLGFSSCKNNPSQNKNNQEIDAAHNSKNSLDWAGVYAKTTWFGSHIQMTLNRDETYLMTSEDVNKNNAIDSVSGKFTWDSSGNSITLDNEHYPQHYQVGENKLIQLDVNGKLITGKDSDIYVLPKSVQ